MTVAFLPEEITVKGGDADPRPITGPVTGFRIIKPSSSGFVTVNSGRKFQLQHMWALNAVPGSPFNLLSFDNSASAEGDDLIVQLQYGEGAPLDGNVQQYVGQDSSNRSRVLLNAAYEGNTSQSGAVIMDTGGRLIVTGGKPDTLLDVAVSDFMPAGGVLGATIVNTGYSAFLIEIDGGVEAAAAVTLAITVEVLSESGRVIDSYAAGALNDFSDEANNGFIYFSRDGIDAQTSYTNRLGFLPYKFQVRAEFGGATPTGGTAHVIVRGFRP